MKNGKRIVLSLLLCLVLLVSCEQHTHDYAVQTTPASCETAGTTVYTCACGDSYTESIPAPGHAWDGGETVTEASCKEEGRITYTCTVCKITRDEALPKTDGHVFAPGVVTKEATCGAPGVFTKKCTLCDTELTEEIAPTGAHTYGALSVTKTPTCKDEGEGERVCTVCSHTVTEAVPVTDSHTFGAPVVLTKETCTAEGSEKIVCTVCEKEQVRTRPRTAHVYQSTGYVQKPDCSTEGVESFRCTACGAVKTESVPKTEDHAWNVGLVMVNPTCTHSGSKVITCTLCREKKTAIVPADPDAHKWDQGTVTKKPLCAIKGIRTYTCTICKEKKQEPIPATGIHTYIRSVHTEPTEEKEGVAKYTCSLCNTSYMDVIPKLQPGTALSYDFDPYHLRTGHGDGNYVDFTISGNVMTVTGKIQKEGLEYIWVRCGDEEEVPTSEHLVMAKSGVKFSITVGINHVTEYTPIRLFTHCTGDEPNIFWSYIYNSVAVTMEDGKQRLAQPALYEKSLNTLARRPSAAQGLRSVDQSVQEFSDSLTKGETDPYRKMEILYTWVTENLYYDYDYMGGKAASTNAKAADVLKNKNAVCVGYVNLLGDLLRAQGIPCHTLETTTYGIDAAGGVTADPIGHVILEAYLEKENRWVLLDPTWDNENRYENGQFTKKKPTSLYFDVSLEYLTTRQCITGFAN